MTDKNDNDTAELVRQTRKLLGSALELDGELGLVDFGHIVGYDGKNVFQTIKRLEMGERGLSGPAAIRMADLAQSASYYSYPLVIIPEWAFFEPAEEEYCDGSTIYLDHLWFPRMRFAATCQAELPLIDLNFNHVGFIKSHDPDLDEYNVMAHHQDLLPHPDWYTKFYEEAVAFLSSEANRQFSEDE